MDKFMDETNLCDLMADFLPPTPPKTYQRGRHKIDHIVGTMGINLAMIRAYIIPFGDDSPRSDHAICGIDFSMDVLCGISAESLYDPTHPSARQLWSTDIKASENYVEMVERRFDADNIVARVATLLQRCTRTGQCTPNDESILNSIDLNITRIMLWVENQCKRAKGHDWSPLLATAGCTVIAAKWNLSNIMMGRTTLPMNVSRDEAITKARSQIKDAYSLLRKVQKNAKQIRETFLEDRATHLEETRAITKAAALRQLISAE
jgi:hypothetical protein